MKEFYIDGYDVVEQFPDDTPDNVIQETLNKAYPETDDQFVSRIADPATPASAVSFEDFQRYQALKPELSVGDLAGLVAQGAGVVASELMNGVRSTLNLAAQGQLGEMGASLVEGAARGTYDLGNLAMRIGDNLNTYIEPYIQDTGDGKKDQYNRFLAIKEMDSIREAARKGDSTILSRFGISADPASINTEMAEAASYFLDPSVLLSGGSTKVGSFLNKSLGRVAAKPAELASRATGAAARGLSSLESKVAEKAGQFAKLTEEATGGLGKYALPGGVGAVAGSVGLAPAAGVGVGVAMAVPTLEVASGLFKGFANSMGNMPTRIGPLHHLAMNSPQTRAGRMAGRLKFLDPVTDYAGRAAGGAVQGAAYGAGLGALAGGVEGAAQGLGAGGVLGAGAGGFSRATEGLSGVSKRRAEANDYQKWYTQQPREVKDFMDQNVKSEQARIQVMDGWQMFQTALGDEADIRIISDDDFRARFQKDRDKATGAGVQVVEGERPVIYINGKKGDTTTLFHEMFHGIARLDGFDGLVSNIASELGKMYSPAEINQFVKEYEASGIALKGREGLVTTDDKFSAIMEELGAEHFANFIQGKDSSYLLKGSPIKDALSGFVNRFVAGKLDRIYDTFESPIFQQHLKRNRALDRAMNDLVKARRKAYKQVELSADDYIRAYGESDLGDDNVFNELQALGVAELDNKGKRVIKSNYRIGKETKELGKQLKDTLAGVNDAGGMLRQSDGSYSGRSFSPDQLQALLDAPFLSDKVKEVIQFIADIRQSGSDAVNVTYGAATYKTKRGKTRAKNLPISNRDALIYGLTVSPVGTITANILDLSLLRSKIQRLWSGDSRLHNLFGSPDGMYNDALTYVNALGGDVPTAQVLGSAEKRNHLNKMLGVRNVKGNPELPDTYNLKEADHPWRSFRLDRFVKARKLEDVNAQFSQRAYEMAQVNFSPEPVLPVEQHPENQPVQGRLTKQQADRIKELQQHYEAKTPERIKVLKSDAIESMSSRLINLGIPVSEARTMASDTFKNVHNKVNGAVQVISGMGKSDLSRLAGSGRPSVKTRANVNPNWLTSAFESFENDIDLAMMKAQQVGGAESGVRQVTPEQGQSFVTGERLADTKAFGSSLRDDVASPPRVYASVVEGQKFGSQGNYNVFFEWDQKTPIVATSHHHYGVANGLTDIHASANVGDKNARTFGDPSNETYTTLPSGKKVLDTHLLVGNKGIPTARTHQLMVSTPSSGLSEVKKAYKKGGLSAARKELAKVVSSELVGKQSQGKAASYASPEGVPMTVAIQRNRTEAYVLNPDLSNVKKVTIVSNKPDEVRLLKENIRQAFKNNSSKLPPIQVVSADSGPSGNKGRKAITDEHFKLTGETRFSPAKLDTDHANAVQSGDMETAQRLVDEAAKKAGYTVGPVYHGGSFNIESDPVFRVPSGPERKNKWQLGFGTHFAADVSQTEPYLKRGGKVATVYLKDNIFDADSNAVMSSDELGRWPKSVLSRIDKFNRQWKNDTTYAHQIATVLDQMPPNLASSAVKEAGYDGIKYQAKANLDNRSYMPFEAYTIVSGPSAIKSANPATYDDKGNLIPLSERFNPASDDIRFSPSRTLNNRGGAIYTTEQGHRAVQTSSRAGVRVYDSNGRRIGPVFQSVEKAERYLQSKAK